MERNILPQGIRQIETKLHDSKFLVRPARNAFGQIRDNTAMLKLVPQLLLLR